MIKLIFYDLSCHGNKWVAQKNVVYFIVKIPKLNIYIYIYIYIFFKAVVTTMCNIFKVTKNTFFC